MIRNRVEIRRVNYNYRMRKNERCARVTQRNVTQRIGRVSNGFCRTCSSDDQTRILYTYNIYNINIRGQLIYTFLASTKNGIEHSAAGVPFTSDASARLQ